MELQGTDVIENVVKASSVKKCGHAVNKTVFSGRRFWILKWTDIETDRDRKAHR